MKKKHLLFLLIGIIIFFIVVLNFSGLISFGEYVKLSIDDVEFEYPSNWRRPFYDFHTDEWATWSTDYIRFKVVSYVSETPLNEYEKDIVEGIKSKPYRNVTEELIQRLNNITDSKTNQLIKIGNTSVVYREHKKGESDYSYYYVTVYFEFLDGSYCCTQNYNIGEDAKWDLLIENYTVNSVEIEYRVTSLPSNTTDYSRHKALVCIQDVANELMRNVTYEMRIYTLGGTGVYYEQEQEKINHMFDSFKCI